MSRTHASVRYAVGVAGLAIVGTPARKAGANFSSMPHTGKLNALTWNATPGMRRVDVLTAERAVLASRFSGGPSTMTWEFGSSRRPLLP